MKWKAADMGSAGGRPLLGKLWILGLECYRLKSTCHSGCRRITAMAASGPGDSLLVACQGGIFHVNPSEAKGAVEKLPMPAGGPCPAPLGRPCIY